MYTSEVRVLINNKAAFNHTTLGALGYSNASYIMTASSTNTQICFNYSLIPGWADPSVGPCLDNITLELYIPIFNPAGRSTFLCNGDFEAYSFPSGSDFVGVLPNYSCWYDRGGGVLEVQNKLNPDTTKVVELTYYYPYVLCQNVSRNRKHVLVELHCLQPTEHDDIGNSCAAEQPDYFQSHHTEPEDLLERIIHRGSSVHEHSNLLRLLAESVLEFSLNRSMFG